MKRKKTTIPKKLMSMVLAYYGGDQAKADMWFAVINPGLGWASPKSFLDSGLDEKLELFIMSGVFGYFQSAKDKLKAARDAYFRQEHTPETQEALINALEEMNHQLACQLAAHQVVHYPRIKDLPSEQQEPFREFLNGQTCPLLQNLPYEEQDAYYPWDYSQWRLKEAGGPILWD